GRRRDAANEQLLSAVVEEPLHRQREVPEVSADEALLDRVAHGDRAAEQADILREAGDQHGLALRGPARRHADGAGDTRPYTRARLATGVYLFYKNPWAQIRWHRDPQKVMVYRCPRPWGTVMGSVAVRPRWSLASTATRPGLLRRSGNANAPRASLSTRS